MPRGAVVDLTDCSEFRQTLASRPPRIVHGTMLLLLLLLGGAVTWSAIVRANLVVRAIGRVRPIDAPTRLFTPTSGPQEGRVISDSREEGDVVKAGEVLVKFDTAQIDNRIAKLERTLESSAEEVAKLTSLESLLAQQLQSAKEKAQAELAQAETAFQSAGERRSSEIRKAQADVDSAEDHLTRVRKLVSSKSMSEQELLKAEFELRQARERLVQAELAVDDSQVLVARRALELVDRDFAVRRAELEARRVVKEGEAEAARKDLANLNLQREESTLKSPIDGVIVGGRIETGDVLEAGKPVMEIARKNSHMFEAVVSSEEIGELKVGLPVRIKLDAYDYQKYGVLEGTVTYLSPDSKVTSSQGNEESSDQPRSVRSGTAAFVVRIELLADEVGRGELRGPVKLGLGGTAEIVTGNESVLSILVKRIRKSISLG
ncbi:MAG: HlyD family secretion protein [Planctomycetaceae bacterium]